MRKVRWGVLGVANIAVEKVIPAMQRGAVSEIAAIASRDSARARAAADRLGVAQRLRLVRGAVGRSGNRGGLQPAAERAACPLDAKGAGGRQARLVRKADRARRRRGAVTDRRPGPLRKAGRRGLHGALPSPVAPGPRAGRSRGDRRDDRDPDFLFLPAARPGERAQPAARRRRALRHRLLRHSDGAIYFRSRADACRGDARPRPEIPYRQTGERDCRISGRPASDLHRGHAIVRAISG